MLCCLRFFSNNEGCGSRDFARSLTRSLYSVDCEGSEVRYSVFMLSYRRELRLWKSYCLVANWSYVLLLLILLLRGGFSSLENERVQVRGCNQLCILIHSFWVCRGRRRMITKGPPWGGGLFGWRLARCVFVCLCRGRMADYYSTFTSKNIKRNSMEGGEFGEILLLLWLSSLYVCYCMAAINERHSHSFWAGQVTEKTHLCQVFCQYRCRRS